MTSEEPIEIVRHGYDQIADRYLAWIGSWTSPPRDRYLARALDLLPLGSDVLDIGCGAGVPVTAALADGRHVTGVDISAAQIERARANVPAAAFVLGDATTLDVADASLDGVVAFYSLVHLPRTEQAGFVERIAGWLRPGGVFIGSMGARDNPGEVESDWLGVPMFFSHFDAATNCSLVRAAGLRIEESEILDEPEPEGSIPFLWVIARR